MQEEEERSSKSEKYLVTATAVELVECLSEDLYSSIAAIQVEEMRGGMEDAANTPLAETAMPLGACARRSSWSE
jgi:hypothetical protein